MSSHRFIWVFIITTFALTGCFPKDDKPQQSAMDLPPQEGFVLNFDAMGSAATKATADALSYYDYSDAPMSKAIQDFTDSSPSFAALNGPSNHFFAGARVFGWSLITFAGMALPTTSFLKAFQTQPTQLSTDSWQWSYSILLDYTYHARLVGTINNNQVNWEMYISRGDGAFSDVNWYSGTHDLAGTSGSWTLRHDPGATGAVSDFISIDWRRDPTAGTRHIRYTNIIAGDPGNGGYIENGITTASPYDAYFNIDNRAIDAVINIEWNTTDKSGRVKSSNTTLTDHFGHIGWNCWYGQSALDPYGDNATCP